MDYDIIEEKEVAICADLYIRLLQLYFNFNYNTAQKFIYDIIEFLKDEILSNPFEGKIIETNPLPTYLMTIFPPENFTGIVKKIKVIWEVNKKEHQIVIKNLEIEIESS